MNSGITRKAAIGAGDVIEAQPIYSAADTPAVDKISVMYYLMAAMTSRMNCSKAMLDDDKDDQIKNMIENLLQSVDSIDGKESIIAYLLATMKDCDIEIKGFLTSFNTKLKGYQTQINDAINTLQQALTDLENAKDIAQSAKDAAKKCHDTADAAYANYQAAVNRMNSDKAMANYYWSKFDFVNAAKYSAYVVADAFEAGADYTAYLADKVAEGICDAAAAIADSKFIRWFAGVEKASDDLEARKKACLDGIDALVSKKGRMTSSDLRNLSLQIQQLKDLIQIQLDGTSTAIAEKSCNDAANSLWGKEDLLWNKDGGGVEFLGWLGCEIGGLFVGIGKDIEGQGFSTEKGDVDLLSPDCTSISDIAGLVTNLVNLNHQAMQLKIQLNNQAKQDYNNGEREACQLAETFTKASVSNC